MLGDLVAAFERVLFENKSAFLSLIYVNKILIEDKLIFWSDLKSFYIFLISSLFLGEFFSDITQRISEFRIKTVTKIDNQEFIVRILFPLCLTIASLYTCSINIYLLSLKLVYVHMCLHEHWGWEPTVTLFSCAPSLRASIIVGSLLYTTLYIPLLYNIILYNIHIYMYLCVHTCRCTTGPWASTTISSAYITKSTGFYLYACT